MFARSTRGTFFPVGGPPEPLLSGRWLFFQWPAKRQLVDPQSPLAKSLVESGQRHWTIHVEGLLWHTQTILNVVALGLFFVSFAENLQFFCGGQEASI